MRFFKFLFILFFCILNASNNLFSLDPFHLSPEDAKFIDEILGTIPPEERDQIKGQIFEEVNRFQQMTPQDQDLYLQNKFKEMETLTTSPQSPQAPNLGPNENAEPISTKFQETESIAPESISITPKIATSKADTNLLTILESLSDSIDLLLIKVKALPRVSQQRKVEKEWLKLKADLHDLESYLRIVIFQKKALKALSSDEYKNLKNNLKTLESNLSGLVENLSIYLPDTAGLTISFGEEDFSVEKKNESKAQKILSDIMSLLTNNLESKNINEDLKSLLKKHAPEELKKKELPLAPEPYMSAQRSYTSPSFGGGGGYDYNPGYYPYRPSFGDGAGSTPSTQGATKSGLETKDESKKDKGGTSGGGGGKGKGASGVPDKDKDKDKSKDKKEDKDKEKDKDKKEDKKDSKDKVKKKTRSAAQKKRSKYGNPEIEAFLRKLEDYLVEFSNLVDKDSVDILLKGEDKKIKDDFKKAAGLYDNHILKLSSHIGKHLGNLHKDAKPLLMKSIKEIYDDPDYELEKTYKKIKTSLLILEGQDLKGDQKEQKRILEDLNAKMIRLKQDLGLEPKQNVATQQQFGSPVTSNPDLAQGNTDVEYEVEGDGPMFDNDGNAYFSNLDQDKISDKLGA